MNWHARWFVSMLYLIRSVASKYSWRFLRPLLFTLAVLGLGGIGTLVLYWKSGETRFGRTDDFSAWIAVVAFFFMLVTTVAISTWSSFRRLTAEAGLANIILSFFIYAIVFTVAVVAPIWLTGSLAIPVYLFHRRVMALVVVVFLVAGDCFCGLIMLGTVLRERGHFAEEESMSGREAIQELLTARSDLRRLLWGSAALITGVVFVVAGLRNALNSYANSAVTTVPAISVTGLLLYGAFFAVLLALLSVPTYLAWQSQAQGLRDRLYPIPFHGRPSREWYEDRSNLEHMLQMEIGTGQRFAAALGILAPIAVGIISVFIPVIRGS